MILTDMAWRIQVITPTSEADLTHRQWAQAAMLANQTPAQTAALAQKVLTRLRAGGVDAARLLKLSPWEWF